MEHYKIEAINDVLTRFDDLKEMADFADLVEQFEALKTARNEQAAQLELDLQKTRDEALAFFDSVPYLREWISTRFQANIDFNQVFNNYVDENVDLDEMISDRVDFEDLVINNVDCEDLVINNVDCAELVANNVDFDELVSNADFNVDFENLAREAAITAVDDYIRELSVSISID